MISERMKAFFEEVSRGYVASADSSGVPHLAVGHDISVPEPSRLVFEAWFCPRTLANVSRNPRVAVVIVEPRSGMGYQLAGVVEQADAVAMMNGYAPELEEPGMPQVESRLVVRVEQITEFSSGAHSDHPVSEEV